MKRLINALVVVCLNATSVTADDAAELARYLPGTANTVTIVRLADILGTERSRTEHWAEQQEERFLSGAAGIPDWVDVLVMGSLVHPSVPEEVWSAAVVRRPPEVTIESIAAQEQAPVEELADFPAVRTRRDRYVIQPFSEILAAYRPAHRLEASRWVRSMRENQSSPLSPYLNRAVGNPAHVVMALDLQDLLDERRVEQILKEDKRFAGQSRLVERLIPLLTGIQGVTFAATIADQTHATVTIDFSDDVGPSALVVKTLLVSTLDDLGAAVGEFASSQVSSEGGSVILSCELSDESLRRVVSLILTPSTPHHVAAEPPKEEKQSDSGGSTRRTADPTIKYIQAIDKMVDDLRRANRRATDYERTAAWHDNFARKIDELPTAGVDRPALIYGQHIASRFRALAASLRGQAIEINVQQRTLTYDVQYEPGWAAVSIWGGVGYRDPAYHVSSNLQQVRERQAAAIASGAEEREQIWQMIDDERAQIRLQSPDGPDSTE